MADHLLLLKKLRLIGTESIPSVIELMGSESMLFKFSGVVGMRELLIKDLVL